jgi:hypothetical protein
MVTWRVMGETFPGRACAIPQPWKDVSKASRSWSPPPSWCEVLVSATTADRVNLSLGGQNRSAQRGASLSRHTKAALKRTDEARRVTVTTGIQRESVVRKMRHHQLDFLGGATAAIAGAPMSRAFGVEHAMSSRMHLAQLDRPVGVVGDIAR